MKEQAEVSGSPTVGGWMLRPAERPARPAVRRSVAGGFARASSVKETLPFSIVTPEAFKTTLNPIKEIP